MIIQRLLLVPLLISTFLGCNYMRMYPTYSEVSVQHRKSVRIYNENDKFFKERILDPKKYKAIQKQKQEIEDYISTKEDLSEDKKKALRNVTLTAGMSGEDVKVMIGEPSKIKRKGKYIEIWIYKEKDVPVKYYWFHEWAKLHFDSGKLTDIETKHLSVPGKQPNDYYYGIVGVEEK